MVGGDNRRGVIDKQGQIIIPIMYDDLMGFNEGLSAVENEGKYGYININNKLVIPYEYDSTISFTEGLAAVEKK